MTIKTNRIERYYDNHEREGDEVGQGRDPLSKMSEP
jgi:hypothetical protein